APNEREKVARHFARAVAGESSRFPTTFLDLAGRNVAVLASITPVMVRGSVTGVIGMARDISAEQEFQTRLLRANERFRSLFRRSHRAIVALDAEGMIADANPALCELTGYDEAELVGKSGLILAPPGDRSGARDQMNELLHGPALSYELMLHPRTGDDIAVRADVTPIQVGGHVEGAFVALNDLTRERALMRKLDASEELVRALLQIATSSLDAGPQIDFALSVGARALNMQYGYVGSIRNDVLAIRHRYGPNDYLPLAHTLPVTETVDARLVSSPHAIGTGDLTVEPFASELVERGLPWKSYIGSRISVDGTPYGVLVFISTEKRSPPFERAHLDFIDVMGGMMSAAIARELQDES
ncbi:MAG TPA: PAS domain S-box protein, partial [Candidatus Baltobacteraceae bacterium]|nr:PAS domain S-box protein [Candidatus Baltobacteraceae bacterium]